MLAKQIWHLYTEPNSLVTKLLKAKYYPNIDILKASLARNPSYLWRSLVHNIWIIRHGSCCDIGNGNMTNIWKDN